jgi:hypothetical protein
LRGSESDVDSLLTSYRPVSLAQVASVAAMPAVAYLACWGATIVLRGRKDRIRQRRESALRNARARIAGLENSPAQAARTVESVLAGYLADRTNRAEGFFTSGAVMAYLEQRGVPPEVRARCHELLQRCEGAAYGGATVEIERLRDEANECLTVLDQYKV